MLVLARKSLETIHIGNQITISVVSIRGRIVRLGIEAPADLRILRGELAEQASSEAHGESAAAAVSGAVPAGSHSEETSGDKQELESLALEAFLPAPRLTTQHVNRVLSRRRRPQNPANRAGYPILAVS
jgi:carbon storage regulator